MTSRPGAGALPPALPVRFHPDRVRVPPGGAAHDTGVTGVQMLRRPLWHGLGALVLALLIAGCTGGNNKPKSPTGTPPRTASAAASAAPVASASVTRTVTAATTT